MNDFNIATDIKGMPKPKQRHPHLNNCVYFETIIFPLRLYLPDLNVYK